MHSEKERPIEVLNRLIESIDELPPSAMHAYINHYDFNATLKIIRDILKLINLKLD